ncbi:hypothetical protein L211DRAFT_847055 [Terfezia boudieri ATCC MYA-4762]|uniref:Uncharacterized protein n=1 Tax=Terfezia boudieri ATCC MYA-4762 TaxID=1051890 RepID=A0A3N4LVJ5_9PEZI|nr:hypothetical protein L211DRAFT_847055 [Terfezia boudieri ATCC MYA-4762]
MVRYEGPLSPEALLVTILRKPLFFWCRYQPHQHPHNPPHSNDHWQQLPCASYCLYPLDFIPTDRKLDGNDENQQRATQYCIKQSGYDMLRTRVLGHGRGLDLDWRQGSLSVGFSLSSVIEDEIPSGSSKYGCTFRERDQRRYRNQNEQGFQKFPEPARQI